LLRNETVRVFTLSLLFWPKFERLMRSGMLAMDS